MSTKQLIQPLDENYLHGHRPLNFIVVKALSPRSQIMCGSHPRWKVYINSYMTNMGNVSCSAGIYIRPASKKQAWRNPIKPCQLNNWYNLWTRVKGPHTYSMAEPNIGCPHPCPCFGWAWVRYYCSWVGMAAIWVGIGHVCVGMGGHGYNLKGKCRSLQET